ncbi:MAG: TetR family transcriptional regulator [Actinobacteria bacterium]|nr:TetR family transcriptional regulator [Actinomycetota bacterium]NCW83100.1 TetR family transcriptional regulator [Acidimicrobiia bacterium]NBO97172.1 TetR family transcriptional regulator [Actinomycetota bacterium]NBP41264.1 TetR family transcriptional regulator [Actinomycetota bacterium]NBQ03677.1 TetR family transcriptional regulator [Actinomycetota bacterium]
MKKETVEKRRIEILEATCDVVIERGFAGTRVADVAKRLGVSNSLIHYHFASKEELLAAAFEHYARKDLVDMQRDSDSAPTNVAKLWRLIESYVPEGSDDVEWMIWIDAWGEALRNPKMKPISQELDEQSIAVFEKTLRAGNESGEFHCVHPRESATRISGLIDGLAVQYAAHEGVLKRKEFIRLMRQLAAAETGLSPDDIRDSRRNPKSHSGNGRRTEDEGPRPASLATDFDLRQLFNNYANALSRKDILKLSEYFADDAKINLDGQLIAGSLTQITKTIEEQYSLCKNYIEIPLVMAFFADEGNGTAHGNFTIESRVTALNGLISSETHQVVDTYRRTSAGWRCIDRQRTKF